jgi:hypothetical protein
MNKDTDTTKKEVDEEQHLLKGARSVLSGNVNLDGASHRGWFIGHFLENTCGLRATSAVEVKWGVYSAGEERPSWGLSEQATTLCILVRGRVQMIFPRKAYLLSQEGDYLIWTPGIPHQWQVLEETCILTVRWPSLPEAYKERRIFPC